MASIVMQLNRSQMPSGDCARSGDRVEERPGKKCQVQEQQPRGDGPGVKPVDQIEGASVLQQVSLEHVLLCKM